MTTKTDKSTKRRFVKPDLRKLDVKGTRSGDVLDPSEFTPFLFMS